MDLPRRPRCGQRRTRSEPARKPRSPGLPVAHTIGGLHGRFTIASETFRYIICHLDHKGLEQEKFESLSDNIVIVLSEVFMCIVDNILINLHYFVLYIRFDTTLEIHHSSRRSTGSYVDTIIDHPGYVSFPFVDIVRSASFGTRIN